MRQLADGKGLPPCTVLSGNEILLVDETASAFRSAAQDLGCSERTHLVMDARSDWNTALAALQNTSLFGDARLLEISLPSGKPGRSGADTLQKIAQLSSSGQTPDVHVLIRLPSMSGGQQGKWVQTLKTSSLWVDIGSVPSARLPGWISERLARQQQSADAEALAWLGDMVEGNLLAANQEIQKLGLLYGPGRLGLDQIQMAVLNVARYNLYDLRDAMLLGQADRALRVLHGLQAEGEALLLVLWVISEEIRILARLALAEPGQIDAGMRRHRVFGARQQLLRQALSRVPAGVWPRALRHAHEIDRLIKGVPVAGRLHDPWAEIARLVMRIASPR